MRLGPSTFASLLLFTTSAFAQVGGVTVQNNGTFACGTGTLNFLGGVTCSNGIASVTAGGTGTVTSLSQGTGMSFSVNPITTTGTINLANTAVTAASYTNASITVDAQGRITAASSGSAPVTSVTATSPIASSGGATPVISIVSNPAFTGTPTVTVGLDRNAAGTLTIGGTNANAITIGNGALITSFPGSNGIQVAGNIDRTTAALLSIGTVNATGVTLGASSTTVTTNGALQVNGDTTLGNAAADNITTTGTFNALSTWNLGTTAADAILLDIAQPTSNGTRNSHWIQLRGTSYDGSGHNIDYLMQVAPLNNAGTQHLLAVGSRLDAAAFASFLWVTSTGVDVFSGTAAVPGLGSLSDTDTGIWWDNSNALGFSTGGVESFRIDSSQNVVLASGKQIKTTNLLLAATAPTISSGFGTTPSISANNGTAAFRVNVGTGGSASSGVIGLPTATTGWNCTCADLTTQSSTVYLCKQTASSTTTATIGNFDAAGAAAAWVASDILAVSCFAL